MNFDALFFFSKKENVVLCAVSSYVSASFGGTRKKYMKNDPDMTNFSIHLHRNGSVFSVPGIQIKRESGVNPGQSRCCEAPFNILKTTYATDDAVDSRREGFRMGVSQKTCRSLKAHILVG